MKNILFLTLVAACIGVNAQQNPLKALRKKLVVEQAISYKNELLQGFGLGAASALLVDYARSVLPNADKLQLHATYGICRDQLTGEVKMATAVIGASVLAHAGEKRYSSVMRVMAALVGANVAVAVKTYLQK